MMAFQEKIEMYSYIIMMMVVEIHSVTGGIQYICTLQSTYEKDFLISCVGQKSGIFRIQIQFSRPILAQSF